MNPITYIVESMMIPFLSFSYANIYANYGIAIILLTVMVKVIFLPLTQKQFVSMKATQKIQPEIKKLQEKYKGNPQMMQQEMMKLWKEHNVNPLGGCLPILIQLPFLIAIFYTIKSNSFELLLTQPGVNPGLTSFWLADLALQDKTFILPILLGVSTYWSQKLMTTDAAMKNPVLTFMPVLMFFISISMPSGVLLYWAVSQILSAVHQYIVMKPTPTTINTKGVVNAK